MATLTVPLSIGAVVIWFRVHPPLLFGDVAYYESALAALVSDAPLYDPATFAPHVLRPPPFWDQAPSMAVIASLLLLPGGGLLWGLAMVLCVLAGLVILLPRVGPGGVALMAPVLIALPPVLEAMAWANNSALAFAALAVAWRWPRHAGWAIGVATAAKLIPVLMVAWLVGRRDWRGVLIALGIPAALTAVAMVLVDPWVVVDFIRVRLAQEPLPRVQRWGLSDWGAPEALTWVLAFGVAVLAAWRASFSLAVVAVMLVAPATHMHYLVMPLVPAIGIWIPWLLERRRDHRPIRAVPART